MIGNRLARLLTLMLFVFAAPVEAAQPLVTDDAAVVASKTCQLEAWTRSAHDGRAYGAQPACNFTGNLELTVGGARAKPDDGESLLISRRPRGAPASVSAGAVLDLLRAIGIRPALPTFRKDDH